MKIRMISCAISVITLCAVFLAGCGENKAVTNDQEAQGLGSWAFEEPEESRWTIRMGSVQLSLSLFKTAGWEKFVENHTKVLKGFGFNSIESHMHHYRFGEIDNWPEIEKNVKIAADIIHGQGMKIL